MKKSIIYTIATIMSFALCSCEKDNFDPPKSRLEGQIMYQGQPIGVRSNSAELELWQDGYALNEFIPVYISQDGTYSAALFEGEYKMVRKDGNPWLPQLNDTIVIQVNGQTQFDVPITPYIMITEENFQGKTQSLDASFKIDQIVENSSLQNLHVYLNKSILVDEQIHDFSYEVPIEDIEFGQNVSITIEIPENLRNEDYIFARIGAKSSRANEFIYTNVQKIEL